MKKKLIIPTDFSAASLQLIDFAILNFPNTTLDIVLVYGYRVPDSKWGMINFSAPQVIKELQSEEFEKTKNDLIREYGHFIHSISTELYTGTTTVAFQDFCKLHQINGGLAPNEQFLHFNKMNCFDITPLILKNIENTIPVHIEQTYERVRTKLSISNILKL